MVAVLIQSISRWISHGGKPSWCCSKKWTRTHPPQWFFSGQWVNQNVQPYNSLNPWEKQILKKKKVFKWYFLYSLPSKWKDLHLLYLPLKRFKWLPRTGFIAELRLHIIVNPNLCLWTFSFLFFSFWFSVLCTVWEELRLWSSAVDQGVCTRGAES